MSAQVVNGEQRYVAALACRHIAYRKNPGEKESTAGQKTFYAVNTLATMPLWGWVLSLYFEWFAVPVFNVPHIDWKQGIGLALIVGLLRYRLGTIHTSEEELNFRMFEDWTAPVSLLGLGFVVAKFLTGTA